MSWRSLSDVYEVSRTLWIRILKKSRDIGNGRSWIENGKMDGNNTYKHEMPNERKFI